MERHIIFVLNMLKEKLKNAFILHFILRKTLLHVSHNEVHFWTSILGRVY